MDVSKIAGRLALAICPPRAVEMNLGDALASHFARSLHALPGDLRAALTAGLVAYDLGAVARFGRRSSRLDGERARRYFTMWWRGTAIQREFAHAVRGLLVLGYYEIPEVKEAMGYAPEQWVARVTRRRLKVYGDEIRRHERSLTRPDPLVPAPTDRPSSEFEGPA